MADKSNYIPKTFRLPPEIVNRMDNYSDESGISRTTLVIKALKEYMDKVAPEKKKSSI